MSGARRYENYQETGNGTDPAHEQTDEFGYVRIEAGSPRLVRINLLPKVNSSEGPIRINLLEPKTVVKGVAQVENFTNSAGEQVSRTLVPDGKEVIVGFDGKTGEAVKQFMTGESFLEAVADSEARTMIKPGTSHRATSVWDLNAYKDNWFESPGQGKIELNLEGHANVNEGPHVTIRRWNGRRYSADDKYFIQGRERWNGGK